MMRIDPNERAGRLADLIAAARVIEMTPERVEAHLKSFVRGQVMLSNPNVTPEQFEQIWRDIISAGDHKERCCELAERFNAINMIEQKGKRDGG